MHCVCVALEVVGSFSFKWYAVGLPAMDLWAQSYMPAFVPGKAQHCSRMSCNVGEGSIFSTSLSVEGCPHGSSVAMLTTPT